MNSLNLKIVGFVVFTIAICAADTGAMTESALTEAYLKRLIDSKYNRDVPPEGNGGYGSPVDVLCTMYLIDVFKVDDRAMDYRAQFYFRQSWNDSRLAYLDQDIHQIVLNTPEYVWTPDLFFVQEKEGIHHNVITPNSFIRISPDGEILYSVRLSMTFSCPMDFTKYPHDAQRCQFSVESYGYTRDKIELNWDYRKPIPVSASPNITLLPFELLSIKEGQDVVEFSSNRYKVLRMELLFKRKAGFFVNRLYVPFIFLVMISWISFWIPSKLIALRLSLLLVVLYLMVNIGYGINDFIPPSSYTKGSDVWIAVCESLVFAAFLEFIAVHIISRNKEKLQKGGRKHDPEAQGVLEPDAKNNSTIDNGPGSAVYIMTARWKRNVLVSHRIDKICRILFPVLFCIFNCVYWLVY